MIKTPAWWLWVLGGAIGVFLIAPSIVVIIMSFSSGKMMMFPPPGFGLTWYENFFSSSEWIGSALNSLKIAVLSALLATALGTLTAVGLAGARPRFANVTKAIILSPAIVPVVVTAVGMYFTYHRMGLSSFF